MKYSPSTGCFYPEWGKYDNPPADLIDVTEKEFEAAVGRPADHRIAVVNGKVTTEPIPPRPLQERQAAVWERIKAERQERYNSGVLVAGKWFHSDGYSRIQYLGLKDEVKDSAGVDSDAVVIDNEALLWKTMSGAFVPLTRKLVKDIVQAVKVLDKRLFKAAEIHRAAMEGSADPEKYNYSTGWPARYGDAV
jgi:hypothetical protein